MAQKEYDVPGKGPVRYKWETFKKWLQLYQKYGFEGLKPSGRADKGISRKISGDLKRKIIKIAEETDLKTTSNLYRYLLNNGVITTESFTEATLRNFVRNTDLKLEGIEKKERKAFEMPHINMLWTADFKHGPYITVGKRKVKVYLFAIIEDHSRVLVGAMFFFTESSLFCR